MKPRTAFLNRRLAFQLDRGDSLRQRRQQKLAFHARYHLTDAVVEANAKADVL